MYNFAMCRISFHFTPLNRFEHAVHFMNVFVNINEHQPLLTTARGQHHPSVMGEALSVTGVEKAYIPISHTLHKGMQGSVTCTRYTS